MSDGAPAFVNEGRGEMPVSALVRIEMNVAEVRKLYDETLQDDPADVGRKMPTFEQWMTEMLSDVVKEAGEFHSECYRAVPADDIEVELRRELWLNHGHDYLALYGDDGEMQCGMCLVDFKRDPLDRLRKAVLDARLARAADLHPLVLPDPLVGANCYFCGRTADNFHVPDEVWEAVEPVLAQHQACFKCFRIAAWSVGFRSGWQVVPRPS